MTLADVDIAIRSEGEIQRLPEKPLSLGFVPIPPVSPHADGPEQLPLGTDFLHGVTVRVADPDIVLGVDCQAVRLVLVVDDVIADCADQFVVPVELKELRFPDGIALEDPKLSFRSDANSRDTTSTYGQIH